MNINSNYQEEITINYKQEKADQVRKTKEISCRAVSLNRTGPSRNVYFPDDSLAKGFFNILKRERFYGQKNKYASLNE